MAAAGPLNLITDVPGLLVGQGEDAGVITGTTVVLAETPAVAAVDVRGGAPGSRETELLGLATLVERVDAIVLSGGSAFGLDAAAGVMDWLAEHGRGFAVGQARVPIVPAAILFDLNFPTRRHWVGEPPHRGLGYRAVGTGGKEFALGNAGAGLGAKAGRLKGGIGSASLRLADGGTVGALVAVNSWGSAVWPDCGRRDSAAAAASRRADRPGGFFRLRRASRRCEYDDRGRCNRPAARQTRLPAACDHGARRVGTGDPAGAYTLRWRHRVRPLDRGGQDDRAGAAGPARRRRGFVPRAGHHAGVGRRRTTRRLSLLARAMGTRGRVIRRRRCGISGRKGQARRVPVGKSP
jgi:hypothetical protein